jgi:hypothetical protein
VWNLHVLSGRDGIVLDNGAGGLKDELDRIIIAIPKVHKLSSDMSAIQSSSTIISSR